VLLEHEQCEHRVVDVVVGLAASDVMATRARHEPGWERGLESGDVVSQGKSVGRFEIFVQRLDALDDRENLHRLAELAAPLSDRVGVLVPSAPTLHHRIDEHPHPDHHDEQTQQAAHEGQVHSDQRDYESDYQ
jgi:hypothetical protein